MSLDRFLASLPNHIEVNTNQQTPIISIQSKEGLLIVMQLANQTHTLVAPVGTPDAHVWLDMSGLNQVVRHRHEEAIITVESGMTLGTLQQHGATRQQELPLTYHPNRSILDLISHAPISMSATSKAPLKHWVLGLEAITGDGKCIHYGGEVVKNVTGYDLNNLFVGSHSQFGLITQVILKLRPQPQARHAMMLHVETTTAAFELAHHLHTHLAHVNTLTLFKTKTSFGVHLFVELAGFEETLDHDRSIINESLTQLNPTLQDTTLTPEKRTEWITKLDWDMTDEDTIIHMALPHGDTQALIERLETHPTLQTADWWLPFYGHHITLRWAAQNTPAHGALAALQTFIAPHQGQVTLHHGHQGVDPLAINTPSDSVQSTWKHRLKHQFDPNAVLPNRTRYLQESLSR